MAGSIAGCTDPTAGRRGVWLPLLLLFLGGFLLSKAIEHSGAHYRIALTMVTLFGTSCGLVSTARVAREGLLINLPGVVVIRSVCYLVLA